MSVYLVAAYAVFWAFTFVLVLSLWLRQRRVQKDIRALEDQVKRAQSVD